MNETLFETGGLDETRIRRAFGWVITFRDFPAGSYQTVDGDSMMTEALTYFTKGRAEFYLDGVRRKDRVPGILSTEHEVVGAGGTFTLRYVEPTTRVCIPAQVKSNKGKQPTVTQLDLKRGDVLMVPPGFKALVCLGQVKAGGSVFEEESCFQVRSDNLKIEPLSDRALLLDFTHSPRP